ncbi:hypothetical protein SDC9_156600 [bioreactor metagenome]|uniref:Uncharacterized protein n=1 Tax=bioreactor metagenome TaxID=1076179 RepID=A0A645F4W0_9ZZZZ
MVKSRNQAFFCESGLLIVEQIERERTNQPRLPVRIERITFCLNQSLIGFACTVREFPIFTRVIVFAEKLRNFLHKLHHIARIGGGFFRTGKHHIREL